MESVAPLSEVITSSYAIENHDSDPPADMNLTWHAHKGMGGVVDQFCAHGSPDHPGPY